MENFDSSARMKRAKNLLSAERWGEGGARGGWNFAVRVLLNYDLLGEGKYKQFQFINDTELICTTFDSNLHKLSGQAGGSFWIHNVSSGLARPGMASVSAQIPRL